MQYCDTNENKNSYPVTETLVQPDRLSAMRTLSNRWTIALITFSCLVLIATTVFVMMSQTKWDKSLNTYRDANAVLTKTVSDYTDENTRLQQSLAAANQTAEDWQAFAATVSASIVYVPEYHEQTIVKQVDVAAPVYVNNQWQEFPDLATLTQWANDHLVNLWFVGDTVADCDDYAARLQLEAYKDGYIMSVQLVQDGKLFGKNISNYTEAHMGNLVMVGNDIYFVEPQPKYFRVVFVCHRD